MAKKRDTGFIREIGISEAQRDQLAKRDWTKRLEHPEPCDNWTTDECIKKQFSGIRMNRLNGMTEIWAIGKVLVQKRTQDVGNNPALLATMMEEAFSTNGTVLEVELDQKRIRRAKLKTGEH